MFSPSWQLPWALCTPAQEPRVGPGQKSLNHHQIYISGGHGKIFSKILKKGGNRTIVPGVFGSLLNKIGLLSKKMSKMLFFQQWPRSFEILRKPCLSRYRICSLYQFFKCCFKLQKGLIHDRIFCCFFIRNMIQLLINDLKYFFSKYSVRQYCGMDQDWPS